MNLIPPTKAFKRNANDSAEDTKATKRLKVDISPLVTDIIFFGNKQKTCVHPGNEAFADVVKRCADKSSSSDDKIKISQGIVDGLASHNPPVRFLFRNKESGIWSTLSKSDATLITAHALITAERQLEQQKEAVIASKYGYTSWQLDYYRKFGSDPMEDTTTSLDSEPTSVLETRNCEEDMSQDEWRSNLSELHSMESFDPFEQIPLPAAADEPLPLNSALNAHQGGVYRAGPDELALDPTTNIDDIFNLDADVEGSLQSWLNDEFSPLCCVLA